MSTEEAALDWVRRALEEETHDPVSITEPRARVMLQIAEEHSVAVEELIGWIHFRAPEKRWDEVEWTRWVIKYTTALRELLKLQQDNEWRKLCPNCHGEPAHRVGDRWHCAKCGDIQEILQ